MLFLKRFAFVLGSFGLGSLLFAEEASWMRSNTSNALNPKISVIADFVGQSGTGGDPSQTEDGFHLREVEIGIQADIDPYARADFFIGGMNDAGASPELEEGFVTLHSLPRGFQARGGKFRANFGRLNMVHPHELPQVDSPLVLDAFLGEGRLTSTGFELSRLFAPFGLFTEATYALLQDLGGEHGHTHEDGPTTTIIDENDNEVTVPVSVDEYTPAQRIRNFAQVAKVRGYADLSESTNVDVGLSGALHEPKDVVENGVVVHDFDRKRLAALDLTFRWKPLAHGSYRSVLWRTEGFYTDQSLAPEYDPVDGSEEAPAARINRRGAYSYVEVQPAKRWRVGVRGDYVEDPEVRNNEIPHITRALAPYVSFTLSEFNRFRVQWTRKNLPGNETENLGYLQWTVVLGPHGAHAF
jgi:hypothetical protein